MSTSWVSHVDRLTKNLGPISATLDAVVEHLIPQKTASACPGVWCGEGCYPENSCKYGIAYYNTYGYSRADCFNYGPACVSEITPISCCPNPFT